MICFKKQQKTTKQTNITTYFQHILFWDWADHHTDMFHHRDKSEQREG